MAPKPKRVFINRIKLWYSKRSEAVVCVAPDGRVLEEFKSEEGDIAGAWQRANSWASQTKDFVKPTPEPKRTKRKPAAKSTAGPYVLPKGLVFALMSMTVDDSTARLPRGMKPTPELVEKLDRCFRILGAKKMKYSYVFPSSLDARVIVKATIDSGSATPPKR